MYLSTICNMNHWYGCIRMYVDRCMLQCISRLSFVSTTYIGAELSDCSACTYVNTAYTLNVYVSSHGSLILYVCSMCMHHESLPSLNQYSTCTPNTDLCACPLSIRVLPVGEHLPQRDSVAPHITGAGESAVVDGFWSIPCNVDREGYS